MAIDLFGQMAVYESVEALCPAQAEPHGDGGAIARSAQGGRLAAEATISGAVRESLGGVAGVKDVKTCGRCAK
jgi:hypothetical protein